MRVAFHSPLKSPHHPVPSGDRLMARLLIAALEQAGHAVEVVSELRTFVKDPMADAFTEMQAQAGAEIERISAVWQGGRVPDLWLTYHPYYKAPDLLGPHLSRSFDLTYVTVEASYSARRNVGAWANMQSRVLQAVEQAAVNICLTRRDLQGLTEALPKVRSALLPPFLDVSPFPTTEPAPLPHRLITVAMMRPGDKMDSYRMLAEALKGLADLPWTLSIVGNGPCRAETASLFAGFGEERIIWHGEKDREAIAALLAESAVYVWPGCGEAYGLAYLEAQAVGVPVVAQAIAGVPEVVEHGRTGLLTPPGDVGVYAEAIRRLLTDETERAALAAEARRFVREERSLGKATERLDAILKQHMGPGK
jgi:glycosyltransferase involved in cell wall biosynthesis